MWDGKERRAHVREHMCVKEDQINKLYDFHDQKMKQLADMEKRQIAIGANVDHIKGRIDNGMSHTIEDIHTNLVKLIPIVDRHTALEKRLEDWFWGTVKGLTWLGILASIGLMTWAISIGYKPNV